MGSGRHHRSACQGRRGCVNRGRHLSGFPLCREVLTRTWNSPTYWRKIWTGFWKRNARRTSEHRAAARRTTRNEKERSSRMMTIVAEKSGPIIWWRDSGKSKSAEEGRCHLHHSRHLCARRVLKQTGRETSRVGRRSWCQTILILLLPFLKKATRMTRKIPQWELSGHSGSKAMARSEARRGELGSS
jgi:hypothetical protein